MMRHEVGDCVWSFIGESLVHVMIHQIIGDHAITSDAEVGVDDIPDSYCIRLNYCYEQADHAIDAMARRLKHLDGEEHLGCSHDFPLECRTVRMGFQLWICGSCLKVVDK